MNRNVRRYAWRALLLGLVLVVGGAAATSLVIGRQVRGAVAAAQSWEPGDPVEALLAVATSPDYAVAERNRAVWALGQLGDSRAVALLATLHTDGLAAAISHKAALPGSDKRLLLMHGVLALLQGEWRRAWWLDRLARAPDGRAG